MYSTLLILWRRDSWEVTTSNFGSVGQGEEGGVCPLMQIDPTLMQHWLNTDPTPIQHWSNIDPTPTQQRPSRTVKNVVVVCTPCVPISVLNHGIANPCTWLYMRCCSFLFMFVDIGLNFATATSKPFNLFKIKAHYFESESECSR